LLSYLAPIAFEIIIWSGLHDDRLVAMRGVLEKGKKDRQGFEASLRPE
jgi:hypothetical protein